MAVILGLVNRRNISLLVAIKKMNPRGVYLLHSGQREDKYDLIDIKEFLNNSYPKLFVKDKEVDCFSCKEVNEALAEIANEEKEDLVIDLSNGHPAMIAFLKDASYNKYPVFIFSERDDRAILMDKGECRELDLRETSFEVKDFIESGGGTIYHKSTGVFNKEEIRALLSWQMQNYEKWMKVDEIIKRKALLRTFGEKEHETRVLVNMKNLSHKDKILMLEYIYILHKCKLIKMEKKNSMKYFLNFKSIDFKHYVMTYGTWLEALTYTVTKHLGIMDNVESEVTLFWSKEEEPIVNEIDVMAVYNGKLVAISCKDSARYDEKSLEELEMEAFQLGGESSIKILVATSLPSKRIVEKRAKQMDINLIIFDGDLKVFCKEFKTIFEFEKN